jgi:hypothetical protein
MERRANAKMLFLIGLASFGPARGPEKLTALPDTRYTRLFSTSIDPVKSSIDSQNDAGHVCGVEREERRPELTERYCGGCVAGGGADPHAADEPEARASESHTFV